MPARTTRVLLIEDNEADADWTRRALACSPAPIHVEQASSLMDGLESLISGGFDAVLLDLGLPDSNALHTVLRVREQVRDVAVIVLSGNDDEQFALAAIGAGAQDYVVKGSASMASLVRTVRYAVTRNRQTVSLRAGLLRDPLTGFLTEAGFVAVAESYCDTVAEGEKSALVTAALDNFGKRRQAETETLLLDAAAVLAGSFRTTDIYGAPAPGRFAVLVRRVDGESPDAIVSRLRESVAAHNEKAAQTGAHHLSFSIRVVSGAAPEFRVRPELLYPALV